MPKKLLGKEMEQKYCYVCGKVGLSKNEIGLNKKLLASKPTHFYCLDCLAEYLEVDTDFLLARIAEYKEQGCVLFG